MNEPIISINRNIAIGSAVGVLLLAALGCYYFFFKVGLPFSDELTNVIQKPVELPDAFREKLNALGIKGLILVSKEKKDQQPIITVINADGTTIDVCGSVSETDKSTRDSCKLATTAKLVNYVSGTDSQGYCSDLGGNQQECHTINRKYPYHTVGGHHTCRTPCR